MTPDTVFQLSSTIAMIGWLLLIIVSPFRQQVDIFITGIIVTGLCLVYAWLVALHFKPSDMASFGSLEGVMGLFTHKAMVTAGWVHYLAFDLFTGIWIRNNARKHRIPYAITVVCLLFTFLLGPVGFLLYLLVRTVKTKSYFQPNH